MQFPKHQLLIAQNNAAISALTQQILFSRFADEKTEAQRGLISGPRSHRAKGQGHNLDLTHWSGAEETWFLTPIPPLLGLCDLGQATSSLFPRQEWKAKDAAS